MRKLNAITLLIILLTSCSTPEEAKVITEQELSYYNQVQDNQDETVLAGLSPQVVATLYYYAAMIGDYETQYTLYTDQPERIAWTREEDKAFPIENRATKENAIGMIGKIKRASFVETSSGNGYLSLGDGNSFQMVKEDNIWKVGFMPLQ